METRQSHHGKTDQWQLIIHTTLKMISAQVVETSVIVNDNRKRVEVNLFPLVAQFKFSENEFVYPSKSILKLFSKMKTL